MKKELKKWLISLEIENFKSIKHLKIDFKKNNINLIYGDNGIGKTTFIEIFKFITKLWRQINTEENVLINPFFSNNINFDEFYSIVNEGEIKPIKINIKLKIGKDIFKYFLLHKEGYVYEEKLSILKLDEKDKEIFFEKIFNKKINISSKLKVFNEDKNIIITNKTQFSIIAIISNYFKKNYNFIKENYSKEENDIFFLFMDLTTAFYCFIIDNKAIGNLPLKPIVFKDELHHDILIKKDNNFDKNLNYLKDNIKKFEDFLIKIDNRIIGLKLEENNSKIRNNIQYNQYKIFFEKKINGDIINTSLEKESTGTRLYIEYFNLIYVILNHNSIIFFDEFGMHFHPSLAIKILKYIKKIAKENEIQLFLTTHNTVFLDKKNINLNNKEKWIITSDAHSFVNIKNFQGINTRMNNYTQFMKGLYGGQSNIDDL